MKTDISFGITMLNRFSIIRNENTEKRSLEK